MTELVIKMGKPGTCSVEEGSFILRRLYGVERELMRTLGGYLVNVQSWELKTRLPRHIWQDSLRADALRTRILEMRYPRRDVDQGQDEPLRSYLSLLIRCTNDAELLEGVYLVTKKALLQAYEDYLLTADELDDAPSIEILSRFIPEIQRQVEEAEAWYEGLGLFDQTSDWYASLQQSLLQIKGVVRKTQTIDTSDLLEMHANRPEYVPSLVPVRDPQFTKSVYHMPPRDPQKFIERQVWAGISHVNEIWASEIAALVLWKWDDMPWDFYLECARWAYDESRHCLMGVRRLEAWGFKAGVDYPIVADHYESVSELGELAVLALLHAFEINGPYWKSKMKSEFEQLGDTASSQDFDYDWADESIHLQYGHKWVLHRLNGDLDAMEELQEHAMAAWQQWIEARHREWDYEPFLQRIEQKISEIETNHRD